MNVIDLKKKITYDSSYSNTHVTNVNDHVIRLSVMTEPFYWHYHPNSDETFLVIEGILCIDLEDRTVILTVGQLFTVPANVKHCTRPQGERSVNISFESANMATVRC